VAAHRIHCSKGAIEVNDQMNKAQLLSRIQTARAPLDAMLAQLTDEQMTQPGVEGKSSVKDILAHITTWEQHCVRRLQAALHDGKAEVYVVAPGEPDGTDAVNELMFEKNQQLSLRQVLSDFHQSLQEVLQTVERISEKALLDPIGLAQVFGYPVERVIGSDTFVHYPEHIESIRTWLENQGG
jgi:hypothetical protein